MRISMCVSAALTPDRVDEEHVPDVERNDLERRENAARIDEAREVDPSQVIEAHSGMPGKARPTEAVERHQTDITDPTKVTGRGLRRSQPVMHRENVEYRVGGRSVWTRPGERRSA